MKVTDDSFTITDDSKELRWEAGHPKVAGSATRTRGRTIEIGREKIWAIREDGTVGPVVDYRLDSEEGRELVTTIGRDLGLTPRRGTEERIGLYAAVGAIGLILLVGLVALLDAFVV